MKHFNHKHRGGKRDFKKGKTSMHQATCSACGDRFEIPFKPTNNKPVYCSHCFKDHQDSDRNSSGRFERRNDRGPKMYKVTCSDCGNKCEVPFKPSNDKPVRCNDCFRNSKGENFRSKDSFKKGDSFQSKSYSKSEKNYDKEFEFLRYEMEDLNEKLDKVLKILNIIRPEKKVFTVDQSELSKEESHEESAE